jgi:type II secretory pathway component PulF
MVKMIMALFLLSSGAFIELLDKNLTTHKDLELVILLIAFVCALCGALLQYVEVPKLNNTKEKLRIVAAVPVITILSWGLGVWLNKWWLTAIIATLGGFMSLDLLNGLKSSLLKIVAYLPEVLKNKITKK